MCGQSRRRERRLGASVAAAGLAEPLERSEVRVSDVEREAAADELRVHAGAGRLELDELDERIEAALCARTRSDLATVLADLPPATAAAGEPRRRRQERGGQRFTTYLWVMALLIAIWLLTGAGHPWPLYPALGWGIPLLLTRPGEGRTQTSA